jgi:NAD(P)-dependent dehydrogenase (short-subunit alcohol dehydrogenase family)
MDLGLEGKTALVTGGSDGIGKAAAGRLVQEGARVAICARRADVLEAAAAELRDSTGGHVMAVRADLTDPAQIQSMFDTVIGTFGRIDILVNNAGTSMAGHFGGVTDETWTADLSLKVFGAIRCSRLAIPHMQAQGWGRIINITTPGGKAPAAESVPTSVSRAAGIALTKEMSLDYARDNILVNTVCIGLIESGQHRRRWEAQRADGSDATLEEWYADMGKGVPLGRVGKAEEAADLIAFLASERASYITGTAVNMDGGSSAVV